MKSVLVQLHLHQIMQLSGLHVSQEMLNKFSQLRIQGRVFRLVDKKFTGMREMNLEL